jgi:hypothetical protein
MKMVTSVKGVTSQEVALVSKILLENSVTLLMVRVTALSDVVFQEEEDRP